MAGENTLGLDALNEDLSVDLDGNLTEGLPELTPPTGGEGPKETEEINKPGEGTDTTGKEIPAVPDRVAKEKDTTKTPEESTSNSSPGLSKIYSSLATELSKEGVLSSLDENTEITDFDKLSEAIEKEVSSRLDSVQQEYKKAMESGVEQNEFVNYQRVAAQLDSITSEMLEADDDKAIGLRKNIIAQDFLNRGFDRESALKYAERSVSLAEDVNDAKNALAQLKEHNQSEYNRSVQAAKDKEQAVHDDIKKFIDNTDEVIKGIKIGERTKAELLNAIITPVGRDKDGKATNAYYEAYQKDPIKYQVIQNYLYMMTKGYTDFSKINNATSTRVSREIDEVLKNTGSSFLESGAIDFTNTDDQSSFSIGDGFELDI